MGKEPPHVRFEFLQKSKKSEENRTKSETTASQKGLPGKEAQKKKKNSDSDGKKAGGDLLPRKIAPVEKREDKERKAKKRKSKPSGKQVDTKSYRREAH